MTSYMSVTLGLETTLGKVADLRGFAPKGSLQSSMESRGVKGRYIIWYPASWEDAPLSVEDLIMFKTA